LLATIIGENPSGIELLNREESKITSASPPAARLIAGNNAPFIPVTATLEMLSPSRVYFNTAG